MSDREPLALPRQVCALFSAGAAGGASDGQLIERFRNRGDGPEAEAAFAVLVARHGPMVLGVCRRALANVDDADDAFQATFLVLVKKAGAVRVDDSLGRWLYGVSRRVAARARTETARRARRERTTASVVESAGEENSPERRELLAALDEEIARLPAAFRTAVVLCDLEGVTHETAAEQLRCPVGTIESRLFRGRKRLREQLARRGFAPEFAATAGLGLVPPAVPEMLLNATVDLAARDAPMSKTLATLLHGALHDMFWTKVRIASMSLGAVALACGLGTVAAGGLTPKEKSRPAAATPRQTAPVHATASDQEDIPLQPTHRIQPGDTLLIEVLEAMPGRPISGLRLVRPDGTISLSFYGNLKVAGLTRDEIKVKLIERLQGFLPDEALGLEAPADRNSPNPDPENPKMVRVAPVDSDRVFVDESPTYYAPASASPEAAAAETKLVEPQKPNRDIARLNSRMIDHERRLSEIEAKLDRLLEALGDPKGERK